MFAFFFNFLLMAEKNLFTVWAKYLMHLNDLIKFFQKIVWLIGFRVTVRELLRAKNSKKLLSQKIISKSCIFKG